MRAWLGNRKKETKTVDDTYAHTLFLRIGVDQLNF